jgi:hypothetical protein
MIEVPVRALPSTQTQPTLTPGVVLIDLPTWSRRLTSVLLHEVPEHRLGDVQAALGMIRQNATACDRLGIICRVPPPTSTTSIELGIMRLVDCASELFQSNATGEDPDSIDRRRLASNVHRSIRALRKVLQQRARDKA